MRKILQFMKNNLVGFILGVIVTASIGVYAVSVASSEVTYDNTNSGSSATTVKDAIDDLYLKASTSNMRIEELSTTYAWIGSTITRTIVLPEGVDLNHFILYECGHGSGTYELFVNDINTPVLTTLTSWNPRRTYDPTTRTLTVISYNHGSANSTSYYTSYIAY